MLKKTTAEGALAAAYAAGVVRFCADPEGDPRAPYDGRTALGKAWYAGWRDAHEASRQGAKVGGVA